MDSKATAGVSGKRAKGVALSGIAGAWLVGLSIFAHQAVIGRATPLDPSSEAAVLTMITAGVLGMMAFFALSGPAWGVTLDACLLCLWALPTLKIVRALPFPTGYMREGAVVAVLALCMLIVYARRARRGLVNSVEDAQAYVREYFEGLSGPFTGKEEGKLIGRVMRKFGLSEATAAAIVSDEWRAGAG